MKKYFEYATYFVMLTVLISGAIYVFSVIINNFPKVWIALNSQFFVAILTLFAAFIAYYLYLKQKQDQRRDIASLILQEIRSAEQRIREARARDHAYRLSETLLPTNSWNNSIHLFISELKESGADTISRFYSSVEFLDYLIRKIADQKISPTTSVPSVPIVAHQNSLPVSMPAGMPLPMPQQPAQIQIKFIATGNAQMILKEVSSEVEFIYNSPAVDVLRKIAEQ